MNFQDWMSLTNACLTFLWMIIAYVLFKLQAKTFQVQADTFLEQQRVTEMSLKKFLFDIRPIFYWHHLSERNYKHMRDGDLYSYSCEIILNNNTARNFKIIADTDFFLAIPEKTTLLSVPMAKPITILTGDTVKSDYLIEVAISISFEDEIGTKYTQRIWGTLKDLKLDPPIMI
jgi:hypothetical protein